MTDRVKEVLSGLTGEDFDNNPHLQGTAARWAKMIDELTTQDRVNMTVFPNQPRVDEMVVVSNIPFYSLCAHHIIPFFGKSHVAYVPDKSIIGLSKIPRIVKAFSKGLRVQEELTEKIATALEETLDPVGVAVVMAAEHLCMTMRGVQVPGTVTTTSSMKGCFLDPNKQARAEFLSLVHRNGG